MALAIDANVKGTTTLNGGTATVSLTTTSANEVLLAFVSCGGSSNQGITSVTGGGVTWVKRVDSEINTTGGATATIWSAFAASTITAQTITAKSSGLNNDVLINIISFTGADTTGTNGSGAIGATNTNGFSGVAPSISVTTTRANSWVFAVGSDGGNNSTITAGTGQTVIQSFVDAADFWTGWSQRQNATTPSSGTNVTMNCTAPSLDTGNYGALEVLPAIAGSTAPVGKLFGTETSPSSTTLQAVMRAATR